MTLTIAAPAHTRSPGHGERLSRFREYPGEVPGWRRVYQQQQRPAEIASSCSSVMFGSGGNAR